MSERRIFVTQQAIDRKPNFTSTNGYMKRIKSQLHELSVPEIPIELQDTIKSKIQLRISSRIKRAVHNQPKEPSVVEGKITEFQDSYTIRAFKDFLEERGHYDISVFCNVPSLQEKPKSLEETTCITPKHMLA